MLTVEIRLNGRLIATAKLVNQTNLADVSDYRVEWDEQGAADLNIGADRGTIFIGQHNRRQTAWALVAKAAASILGQKVERMEGRG
jgi:hypothetical protein